MWPERSLSRLARQLVSWYCPLADLTMSGPPFVDGLLADPAEQGVHDRRKYDGAQYGGHQGTTQWSALRDIQRIAGDQACKGTDTAGQYAELEADGSFLEEQAHDGPGQHAQADNEEGNEHFHLISSVTMVAVAKQASRNMSGDNTDNTVLGGVGLALVGFAVFSSHDALIKSVQGIPVFQTAFFVVLFSFVPFTLFLALDGTKRSLRPQLPWLVALRCLFTVIGLVCVFQAFGNLPMAEVYSLLFAAPILITLLAIPILGERIHLIRWFAILLGMAGVLVVLRPGSTSLSWHHLAALGAAACTASSSVVTRLIGSREHSVTLIIYPMLTNVIVTGVATAFVYVPMPGDTLLKLCAVGLLSVIGQTLMIQAYRRTEAQFVAPMQYSQMLWALVFGALVFHEAVDRTVLLGSAVIVCSGLLFIWRELVASVKQPVLHTRNLRIAGGPQARPSEADDLELAEELAEEQSADQASELTGGRAGQVSSDRTPG